MENLKRLFFFSIVAGLSTGLAVSFYVLLTKAFALAFYLGNPLETIPRLPFWYVAFITTSSILIVNLIIANNEKAKEYGVREIARALDENRITFSLGDLAQKIVASALSIGSGFAVGNEGPSAAIGAMIAYRFHKLFNLPKNLLKVSIGIGASCGIAAVFVSPITGILFAVENVAYQLIRDFVGFMIIGSFSAFLVALLLLKPLIFEFSIGKSIQFDYIFSIFLFIPVVTLGIYTYLLLRDKLLFYLNGIVQRKFSPFTRAVLTSILGGTSIALLLKVSPFSGFSGHEVVEELINGKFKIPLTTIFLLILLRIVSNAISLYSNAVGGLFITLMSIGALVGYGFGESMKYFGFNVEPFYFAAIGASVFVGVVMKIPFTAVVLALETTYDYNVVVPVGIVVSIAGFLTNLTFNLRKGYLKGAGRPRKETKN